MYRISVFRLVLFVLILLYSCRQDDGKSLQTNSKDSIFTNKDILSRMVFDSTTCGCDNFIICKRIDSLKGNFFFVFDTKVDFKPFNGSFNFEFPRDSIFCKIYLSDFSNQGNCLEPYCNEIFMNIPPCIEKINYNLIQGKGKLCSTQYLSGRSDLKIYYVAIEINNSIFVNMRDSIFIENFKIPPTIVGMING